MPDAAPGPAVDAEARRRLLRAVHDRRPGIAEPELGAILHGLGVDHGPGELAADLDAVGLEFAADDQGVRRLQERVVPVEPEPIVPAGPPQPVSSRAAIAIVGAAAAALILLAGVIGLTKDDGGPEASPTSTVTTGAPTTGSTTPATTGTKGSTAPLVTAPIGPGGDLNLVVEFDGKDDFGRAVTGGLEDFPGIGPWEVLTGSWSVSDGVAKAAASDGTTPSLAVVPTRSADVRVQISLPRIVSNQGLAFRVKDARNFWLYVASPRFATFALVHVVDGKRTIVSNSGLVRTKGDKATIGVHTVGKTIELLVNGAIVLTTSDPDPSPGTGFGIGALGSLPEVTFDDVIFNAP